MRLSLSRFVANRKSKNNKAETTRTQCRSKFDRHKVGLVRLRQEIGDLEAEHVEIKERLQAILKSFCDNNEYGSELFVLLRFSGPGSMLLQTNDGNGFVASRIVCREQEATWTPFSKSIDYKQQAQATRLFIMSLTLQMEDLAKDQDRLHNLIVLVTDFLNRKTCEVFDALSLSHRQCENEENPGIIETVWNELLHNLLGRTIGWRTCGSESCAEVGIPIHCVPPEVAVFDSVAKELLELHRNLQTQMDQCDDLLYACQNYNKKQIKFEKAWRKPDESRALVLDNSDEDEGDVDVLLLLDERHITAE